MFEQIRMGNDQPGALLLCEFDWEIMYDEADASKVTRETIIDTRQKDLEDSLRTRRTKFMISIKIRKCEPRKEFIAFGPDADLKAALLRRLKDVAFEEEEWIDAKLEVGNFPPEDEHGVEEKALGLMRWALRLSFNQSPIPPLEKWNEEFHPMVESMHWERLTNWYSRKLRGSDGWNFTG
jgi:hypothetical protein